MNGKGFRISPVFIALILFATISLIISFKVITLPSLVIGDNFYWTRQNIADILGLRTIRESYMGDIAILSTFKIGFLFPLTYLFSLVNFPITLIYPFFFYLVCMLSFYFLTREFLSNQFFRILASLLYVINPVIPYYSASLLNAFSLVFLPLTLKFFIKTLRSIGRVPKQLFQKDFAISALFLALTISAQEQFFLSAALLSIFIVAVLIVVYFQKQGITYQAAKSSFANVALFVVVLALVNIPLILSVTNVQRAPHSTYFEGSFSSFIANVKFTYSTANPITLLRLGGDSGTGLGNNAWYDSALFTNLFGYALFIVFSVSFFLLVSRKKQLPKEDRAFFVMSILLFFTALFLIEIIAILPYVNFPSSLFNFLLQTWENPNKLRVVLLLSALTTTLIVFQKLETIDASPQKKLYKGIILTLLVLSMVIYNSPWLIGYVGYTANQQVADNLKWGNLFKQEYSELSNSLEAKYPNDRGIVLPYTHNTELYVPPNFRLFQLFSDVNEKTRRFLQTAYVPWSKLMGLLSAKYVVVTNDYNPYEGLIFPQTSNITQALAEIRKDDGFTIADATRNYTILENQNALPLCYATKYFVFYSDIKALEYALPMVNFKNLPVFFNTGNKIDQLSIPNFLDVDVYKLSALSLSGENPSSNLTLTITNNGNTRKINLEKTASKANVDTFSAVENLSPGDTISDSGTKTGNQEKKIDELILNSTSNNLGTYRSFILNFTVSILENGKYSFFSPRIILDLGDKQYVLILHDDGYLELAVNQGNVATSAVDIRYVGNDLKNQNNRVNVTVYRTFDEVQVYINNNPEMFFQTEAKNATVFLSSEQSISKFTNIDAQTRTFMMFVAERQVLNQPVFKIFQQNVEESVLTVTNIGSEFAVVSQYLYEQNSKMQTALVNNKVEANIFFKAWIVDAKGLDSQGLSIVFGTEGSQITLGLTVFSIVSTYVIMILVVLDSQKRLHDNLLKLFKRIRQIPNT